MNFYLVEDIGPFQYDTTRSAVVLAESAAVAKAVFQETLETEENNSFGGGPLRARVINPTGPRRIIHSHFAAG
jgi:hypothetical protein